MRLINVKTYELQEFQDENEVEYATLSHRWEQEEVLFKDMTGQANLSRVQKRIGWYKIQQCCQQAHSDGLEYVWVDTCCIDKSSSAELQEAINSMFRWYAKALVCYVYVSDVGVSRPTYRYRDDVYGFSQFTSSKWFQRGWTLQELLAPGTVFFYDYDWIYIGNRKGSCKAISQATQIPAKTLAEGLPAEGWRPCVAEIMSSSLIIWGGQTNTDEEILRYSDDQSIFAWHNAENEIHSGLLASSPDRFGTAALMTRSFMSSRMFSRRQPHTITNEGISVQLELVPLAPRLYGARLNAQLVDGDFLAENLRSGGPQASIYLRRLDFNSRYARASRKFAYSVANDLVGLLERGSYGSSQMRQVTVVRSMRGHEADINLAMDPCAFQISQLEYRKRRAVSVEPSRYPVERYGSDTLPVEHCTLWSKHAHGFTATTKLNDQDWTASPWHAPVFSTITLGFDFDFNPLCVLNLKNAKCLKWEACKEIVQAGTPWRRDPNFSAETSTFGFPFTWEASWGCEWRAHSGALLVVRMDLDDRDNNKGFSACFRCQTKDGTTAIVRLGMARTTPEQPWQFSCAVT
ncbi:hypothetical protein LTR70_007256 [Exophiala xenobiotica]|uniref:Heterokaryon incompatibility domain-containing protein n=1 Tax=Lithohypha guttulata TaxID=1690604 RepID=A0ABR0K4X4_9EURO|nr:hypothetical protein LTR24_006840 [Lithohypha guttulata]KAK5314282.1 hypothetical protein LTR70_007256 [Exophiala xenobiotica]